MELKNTISNIDRTLENKNINLSQKRLDEFSNLYSQQLRDRVKEIQLQNDKHFLETYFNDYDKSSEVITEDGRNK